MSTNNNLRLKCLSFGIILLLSCQCFDAKRVYSGSSGRRSSSSSSSNVRRPNSSSKPSYASNSDLTRLSYSPNYNAAPKPSYGSSGTNTHTSGNSQPIGWNVPTNKGPPPSYSATNPVGGGKTNIHEPAPAYKPAQNYNSAPPSYSAATNTHGSPTNNYGSATNNHAAAGGTAYRPRYNGTGGGFGSGYHTPIAATNYQGQQSSYPRQQNGANYSPAGSPLPQGATYYSPGHLPAGASYHPAGALPAGASYHPAGALPAGATYYPAGGVPHGASYYPAAPAAMPAGATYYPSQSALPAGATFLSSPPQSSSSGLGFGSGLLAGGLAGGILGHVLTPSGNRVETVAAQAPASSGSDGKIIIINNGPPGSVTTGADGTTVINAGGVAPAAAPGVAPAAAPAPPAPAPETPLAPVNSPAPAPAPASPSDGITAAGIATGAAGAGAAAAAVASESNATPIAAPSGEQPPATVDQAAPGGIVCVPVKVPAPDPMDSTKTIEVDKIACYPAPQPEPVTASSPAAVENTATSTAPVASVGPTTLPDGVPLAPLETKLPGTPAALSEESGLKVSAASNNYNNWILLSTLITSFVAYCLH